MLILHQDVILVEHSPTMWTPEALAKAFAGVPLFLMAWAAQYQCHHQLASLKKYSLPEKGWFRMVLCPHYTCECILYLALALVAAPQGEVWNQTILCAHIFAVVNLGVTADGTRKWYASKFGEQCLKGKWRMIPWVF
jgi:3-oxo-5-alpha-steroid 4-dehydrogenase 3 / polyprenol reductase